METTKCTSGKWVNCGVCNRILYSNKNQLIAYVCNNLNDSRNNFELKIPQCFYLYKIVNMQFKQYIVYTVWVYKTDGETVKKSKETYIKFRVVVILEGG